MKIHYLLGFFLVTMLAVGAKDSPSGVSATPTIPLAKGQRIYASHHSYFLPLPPILEDVAKTGGYPDQVIVGSDYIGGSKALKHWDLRDAQNKAKAALNTGNVDVLILTPVYLPDDGIEKFAQLALEKNPNGRVTVMEFWLPFDVYNPLKYDAQFTPAPGEPVMAQPAKVDHNAATIESLRKMHEYYFRTMDEYVAGVNKKLGKDVVQIVPVGQAVLDLREKIIAGKAPGLSVQEDLFTDQLGHPKLPIQLLEAYGHYAVIYRKSPVGLPIPAVLANDKKIPEDAKQPLNKLLQELAWEAVTHHSLSGVVPP